MSFAEQANLVTSPAPRRPLISLINELLEVEGNYDHAEIRLALIDGVMKVFALDFCGVPGERALHKDVWSLTSLASFKQWVDDDVPLKLPLSSLNADLGRLSEAISRRDLDILLKDGFLKKVPGHQVACAEFRKALRERRRERHYDLMTEQEREDDFSDPFPEDDNFWDLMISLAIKWEKQLRADLMPFEPYVREFDREAFDRHLLRCINLAPDSRGSPAAHALGSAIHEVQTKTLDSRSPPAFGSKEEEELSKLADHEQTAVREALKIASDFCKKNPTAAPTKDQWKRLLQVAAKTRMMPPLTAPGLYFLKGTSLGRTLGIGGKPGAPSNVTETANAIKEFLGLPDQTKMPNRKGI